MCSRTVMRPSTAILQALPCAVPLPVPLVKRLSTDVIPVCCCRCISVLSVILHYPLTKVCLLCYSVHAESPLFVIVLFQALFYHMALCFSLFTVTYVLYHNIFQIMSAITSRRDNSRRLCRQFMPKAIHVRSTIHDGSAVNSWRSQFIDPQKLMLFLRVHLIRLTAPSPRRGRPLDARTMLPCGSDFPVGAMVRGR